MIDEIDLLVGKSSGDGCERVGGTAFDVPAGDVAAMATWSDPLAVMKIELWTSNFGRLIATGTPNARERCSSVVSSSDGGRIVVRVCHTRDSQVALGIHDDPRTLTPYHLVVASSTSR